MGLLRSKIGFWLVVIGLMALLAPNPAWPRWLAEAVLGLGIALFLWPLLRSAWQSDRARRNKP